ncbi:hypothetical protein [Ornithinimicrobium kibberense]
MVHAPSAGAATPGAGGGGTGSSVGTPPAGGGRTATRSAHRADAAGP